MASLRNRSRPKTKGAEAGLWPVLWRPFKGARQETGYLPDPDLLDAYTKYERRCWLDGKVPEAPEVRFAAQIAELQGERSERISEVKRAIEREAVKTLTLRQWVGSRTYRSANRYDYEFGPFFDHSTKACGERQRRSHVADVCRPEMAELVDRPMDELASRDYREAFQQMLACAACVQRCVEAGGTPGDRRHPWALFVPTVAGPTWDGAECPDHRTQLRRVTYEHCHRRLVAHFNATRTAGVAEEVAGMCALKSPVPALDKMAPNRGTVIYAWSAADGGDAADELRFGFSGSQLENLRDVSPGHLRIVPIIGAWTLSRAGQELFGFRRRDIRPENPFAIRDFEPGVPCGPGMINVHNFRHYNVDGTYRNKLEGGKTSGARRECPGDDEVMAQIIEHIVMYRSTPDANCAACNRGVGEWSTDDWANNPHVYDEAGGVRCPLAADAPLLVDENGEWFRPHVYTEAIWPEICEAAALTEETLGWKPLPRYLRSTGTGLMLDTEGVDIDLVVKLGGWANRQMILDHYHRRHRGGLYAFARRVQKAHFTSAMTETEDELTLLRSHVTRLAGELDLAKRRLAQAGLSTEVDAIQPVLGNTVRPTSPFKDDVLLLKTIERVVVAERRGTSTVLEALGLAPMKKNYRRLHQAFERLGLPVIPRYWATMAERRQQPYLDELRAALAARTAESVSQQLEAV